MGAIQQVMLGLGSSTPVFSPSDLGGYDWDIDPDAISGVDGDPVVDAFDISPAGRHYGQNTVARQPTLKVGLYNGHNGIRFGANKCLVPDPTAKVYGPDNTLIVVCTPSSAAEYIIRGSGGQGGPAFLSGFSSIAYEYFMIAGGERQTFAASASGAHILTVGRTDGVGTYEWYFDGVSVNTASNINNGNNNWNTKNCPAIGALTIGTSVYDGDILRIIHYSQNHAGTQGLDDLHAWILDRFAI